MFINGNSHWPVLEAYKVQYKDSDPVCDTKSTLVKIREGLRFLLYVNVNTHFINLGLKP